MSSSFTPLRGVDCKSNTANQLAPISWSLPTQEDSWYPLRKSNELWEWAETCLLRKPYIPLNVSSSKMIWFEWISQQNVRSRIGGCQKTTELWSSSSQRASYRNIFKPRIEYCHPTDRRLQAGNGRTFPFPFPDLKCHNMRLDAAVWQFAALSWQFLQDLMMILPSNSWKSSWFICSLLMSKFYHRLV